MIIYCNRDSNSNSHNPQNYLPSWKKEGYALNRFRKTTRSQRFIVQKTIDFSSVRLVRYLSIPGKKKTFHGPEHYAE